MAIEGGLFSAASRNQFYLSLVGGRTGLNGGKHNVVLIDIKSQTGSIKSSDDGDLWER